MLRTDEICGWLICSVSERLRLRELAGDAIVFVKSYDGANGLSAIHEQARRKE